MSVGERSSKTTITIDREALNMIHRLARIRGVSLYNYVSTLLKKIYEVSGESFCPIDIVTFFKYYKALLPLDPIPVPLNILLEMIKDLDAEKYGDMVKDIGFKVGFYLRKTTSVEDVIKDLYILREMNIFKEVRVYNEGGIIKILLVGSVESDKGAYLMEKFIRGVLEAYEIRNVQIEVQKNMLEIRFNMQVAGSIAYHTILSQS
ncbi:MAG: hypothetical protein QXI68_04000 [Sulfolobales archaeon]